jgi:hypothetical protein
MTPDLLIPIISSIAWLVFCGAALASYRLEWNHMTKLALVWLAIFGGLYVVVEWFLTVQTTTSAVP